MKKTLFLILLGFPLILSGQSSFNKPTISNSGEKSTFSGGSFTWTLGETAVGTITGSNVVLLQGFAPTNLTITTPPTPPTLGTITQPTCELSTGSVELTGLPSSGIWTLTRSPGGSTITGTGTTKTISGLSAGTYTYTVTDANNLTSVPSSEIIISTQPVTPTAPVLGAITHPTCVLATGSVVLNGLPASGTWTLTKSPGGTTTTGTGISKTISGLTSGTFTYTVTNSTNCTSTSSGNIVINTQPSTPTAPVVGTITQPTCALATGTVVLSGLPSTGTWTLTKSPGGTTSTGTGTSTTISGLAAGTYTYTVTNSTNCTSTSSGNIVINTQPSTPAAPVVGTITQPTCALPTGSVVLSGLPSTGSWTVTRSPGGNTTDGSGSSSTITGVPVGSYTFSVTNSAGCTSPSSSSAALNTPAGAPVAPQIGTVTHPTCTITTGNIEVTGLPSTGSWTITKHIDGSTITGSGVTATLTGLSAGTHTFSVTNAAGCMSQPSESVVMNNPPEAPAAPSIGTITHPSCTVNTGSVALAGLPAAGYWTITRTPGNVNTAGSGTSITISDISPGTYTFTFTNSLGCISATSGNVVINSEANVPSPPLFGNIMQPACAQATASVVLTGLPSGSWTLTKYPGGSTTSGTGSTANIQDLSAGNYTFTISNESGCTSAVSSELVINTQPATPGAPVVGNITHPTCEISTGSVIISGLPASGDWKLTRTPGAVITNGSGSSILLNNIPPGTYTYTVTNSSECTSPASGNVVVNQQPVPPAAPVAGTITQPTCLIPTGSIAIAGLPGTGTWVLSGIPGGEVTGSGSTYNITGLSTGSYVFSVTPQGGCQSPGSGTMIIEEPDRGSIPEIFSKWDGEVLFCENLGDSLKAYQWYKDGILLPGETLQYIVVKNKAGVYTVQSTDINGCRNFSSPINFQVSKSLTAWPNPASESFSLGFEGEKESGAVMTIINSLGIKIREIKAVNIHDQVFSNIDVSDLEKGTYIIKLSLGNSELYFTKLVIIK